MDKNTAAGNPQDEVLQKLMKDIVKGAKAKLVEPVLDENRRLSEILAALGQQEREQFSALQKRLDHLEASIQQIPILILAAIRDAINQAGVDVKL